MNASLAAATSHIGTFGECGRDAEAARAATEWLPDALLQRAARSTVGLFRTFRGGKENRGKVQAARNTEPASRYGLRVTPAFLLGTPHFLLSTNRPVRLGDATLCTSPTSNPPGRV